MDEVSWKEYVDMRIKSLEKASEASIQAAKDALEAAKVDLDRRLGGMNDFREQLQNQANTFVTKIEHDMACKEIESLKLSRAELQGKANQSSVNIGYIIAVIGIVLSIVALIMSIVMGRDGQGY